MIVLSSTLHPRAAVWSSFSRSSAAVSAVPEASRSKGAFSSTAACASGAAKASRARDGAPACKGSRPPGVRWNRSTSEPWT